MKTAEKLLYHQLQLIQTRFSNADLTCRTNHTRFITATVLWLIVTRQPKELSQEAFITSGKTRKSRKAVYSIHVWQQLSQVSLETNNISIQWVQIVRSYTTEYKRLNVMSTASWPLSWLYRFYFWFQRPNKCINRQQNIIYTSLAPQDYTKRNTTKHQNKS